MKSTIYAFFFSVVAAPTLAEGHIIGDIDAGEKAFKRQCSSCHVVRDDEGNVLAGRTARTGPNLYGLPDAIPGSVRGFNYSKSLISISKTGIIWDQNSFITYVMNPTSWLRDTLDDRRARSRMSYRVRNTDDAVNIYAYLAKLSLK